MERIKLFENAIQELHSVKMEAVNKMTPSVFQICIESILLAVILGCAIVLGTSVF